ncbi:peptide ABC transporter permease [uncultured Nitratireductor sp.]|uniref:peptide ABC transporter permease n=1 Tax=uncultured Nitratireductor sp. TaxID=520953 RepID=UPI0025D648E2|nr:peptide ABC transporter permease [uncultured Nitratireductor sp.]
MSEKPDRTHLSGEEARQGHIVLRTPLRRTIFIAGLAGIVVLALVWALVWALV